MGLKWGGQDRRRVPGIFPICCVFGDSGSIYEGNDVVTRISLSATIACSGRRGTDGRGRPFARYPLVFAGRDIFAFDEEPFLASMPLAAVFSLHT